MQYPVPQFDDVEDKVIGPLSFRQFVYIVGGAGLSYVILTTLPAGLNLLLIVPVASLSLALAFYKINKQPFIDVIESGFYYMIKSKLYLWKHQKAKKQKQAAERKLGVDLPVDVPSMSNSKMKDLAWSLDINEKIEHAKEAREVTKQNVLSTI